MAWSKKGGWFSPETAINMARRNKTSTWVKLIRDWEEAQKEEAYEKD